MQQHSVPLAHENVGRVKGSVEPPVAFAEQLPVNEVVDFVTGHFVSSLFVRSDWALCLLVGFLPYFGGVETRLAG